MCFGCKKQRHLLFRAQIIRNTGFVRFIEISINFRIVHISIVVPWTKINRSIKIRIHIHHNMNIDAISSQIILFEPFASSTPNNKAIQNDWKELNFKMMSKYNSYHKYRLNLWHLSAIFDKQAHANPIKQSFSCFRHILYFIAHRCIENAAK